MTDDLINRQAAIDAVNNMIRRKFGISADLGTGALLELPSATDTNVGGNLIDRQAALDVMETWDKFGCDPDGKLVRYDDDKHYIPYVHYEDMVHAIKHLPSAQQWIPCSTEMPPTGKDVLVTLVDGAVTDGERWKPQEGKWFLFSDGVNGLDEDVLAWMPLPAPYRPEGENSERHDQ